MFSSKNLPIMPALCSKLANYAGIMLRMLWHAYYAGIIGACLTGGPVTGEIVDDIRNMGMIFHIPAYFRLYFKYNDVIYIT